MSWYVVRQAYEMELPDTPYNLWCSGEVCIDGAPRPPLPDSPRARRKNHS
ncbi:hypothetical protein [Actinomadura rudentiformis]|nr:hypothetical protein [Actinomadura rudentiformis]